MANMSGEAELYSRLLENLRHAEECARGLAYHREDIRWVKIAGIIGQMEESVKTMIVQSARHALRVITGQQ